MRLLLMILVSSLIGEICLGRGMTRQEARAAEQLIVDGKFMEAEARYQEVLDQHPGSILALSNLGVVYYRMGRILEAIHYLEKAVRLVPTDGFSHRTLGMCYLKADELTLAIKHLERAIKLNPQDSRAHNFMGIVASKKGWWQAAEEECKRAIELDPEYADAYFNLAVIYSSQDPPRKALGTNAYRKAAQLGAPPSAQIEKKLGIN